MSKAANRVRATFGMATDAMRGPDEYADFTKRNLDSIAASYNDPFATYGALHPRKARAPKVRVVKSDADAPMKPTAMEQAQRDKSAQLASFKRAKKAEHQAMVEHPDHGAAYSRMIAITKRLPGSAVELIEHLRNGWLAALSSQQKHTVLSMISARIIYVRLTDGRSPMDDPLPGEPDNLFLICRNIIMGY